MNAKFHWHYISVWSIINSLMSSLLVVLHDLSAWFSIFDTAHLTDLGSKTGYRRLTSLKMSKNLLIHLIHLQLAFRSQFYAYLMSSQGGVPS